MAGLLYGASYDSSTHTVSLTDKAGNTIYSFVVDLQPEPIIDDPTKPLYLRSLANGSTVTLSQSNSTDVFEISSDNVTWETATKDSPYTLDSGEGVYIRAQSARTTFPTVASGNRIFHILVTGTIEAYNNVNSVLTPTFASLTDLTTVGASCLRGLFSRTNYRSGTFDTALVKAPLFPATILSDNCYQHLFYGCRALTQCVDLSHVTTLASASCRAMYYECTALTTAKVPGAVTLATNCYTTMFQGCISLTSIESLPFTDFASGSTDCCSGMFRGCTALTVAPELKPTVLVQNCYNQMFYGCTALSEVRIGATDISASNCLNTWLSGVSATGNFYAAFGVAYPVDSTSGIPQGWMDHRSMVDNPNLPLYLKSTQNGSTVELQKVGTHNISDVYEKSSDNVTWTAFDSAVTLNAGEGIFVRIQADRVTSFNTSYYIKFVMTGSIQSYNNVNSLLSPTFNGITDLTTLPNIKNYCFHKLFTSCTALTKAPLLPATTLSGYCYYYMFEGCSSLTQTPDFPATTLESSCYGNMFESCTALTTVSPLPATTLTTGCYNNMFKSCSSLVRAPELPALTVPSSAYRSLFEHCTSLNYAKIYATDISASYCLRNWLTDTALTGDIFCDPNTTFPATTTEGGYPSGWTRHALT